jgi:hypothetical protein
MTPLKLFARSAGFAILLLGAGYVGAFPHRTRFANRLVSASGMVPRYLYIANQTDESVSSFTVDAMT